MRFWIFGVGAWVLLLTRSVLGQATCPAGENVVLVRTTGKNLALCEAGNSFKIYPVALGWEGTGKRVHDDGKTPLGTYSLGAPRESKGSHT